MWFRRDLRLADNPALLAAIDGGEPVVPLFVLDDALLRPAGQRRLAFLAGALRDLHASTGGALVIRRGDPALEVPKLAADVDATAVYCAADFGPYGSRRDDQVEKGVELRRVGSPYAVDPGAVLNQQGEPYRVFTPFYRAWRAVGWARPQPKPRKVDWAAGVRSEPLPGGPNPDATEARAHRRLAAFEKRALGYERDRDRPDLDATSHLSPYLKFGLLHPRQVLAAVDSEKFRREVAWREFCADVLWHDPGSARRPGRVAADRGTLADQRFEAWTAGRTGYPIVDAGMRQLAADGWLPNRVRMIVASFLVKDLHLDWRRGARWFMRELVDGDLASNQYNWRWVAGEGADAAPWFRIFNPVTQAKQHDPNGDYVRRWVADRAEPIVDHAAERAEALARHKELRSR